MQFDNSNLWTGSGGYRFLNEGPLSGWSVSKNKTADEVILSSLEKLQAHSSDQIRNDALASAAINNLVTGTVGSGLKPQPAIDYELLNISSEEAHEFTRKAEQLFQWWGASKACDFSKNHTFWEMESLVLRSALEFGDTFVLKRKKNSRTLDLSLQMIEAPRVKTPLEIVDSHIRAGLEHNEKTGEITHLYIANSNNFLHKTVRFPLYDKQGNPQLIHLANKKRIGQSRGVPYLATVTPLLKQLSRFAEGETAAAVLNSFLAFVTKTRDGSSPLPDSGVVGASRNKRQIPNKITPSMNVHLREGESIEMLDPKRPNSNFSTFFDSIVKLIGAELEVPFEVLISSFNSSYSASRAAMVKAFQVYKLRRKWLVENFHKQVWDWFIESCIEKELLSAPGFFEDPIKRLAYTSCEWVGDSALQLDPVKEAAGAGKLHELGVISKKTLTQLLTGQNYENVVEQRKKERALEEN